MKTYTIIAGVNGTGKSSLTGVLRAEMTDLGAIIDVDRLSKKYGDPIRGGKAAISKIEDCLSRGVCFTQETTLSGVRTAKTAQRAMDRGYAVRLYYVGLDTAEESLRRIANRVAKGGHSIPEEDVRRRFANRWQDLARVLPYCDEATFYDNENGFAQVGAYRNGELLPVGNLRPDWLEELRAFLDVQS